MANGTAGGSGTVEGLVLQRDHPATCRLFEGNAMHPGSPHSEPHGEHPHRRPIDESYRIVVRTALWVIAGAVFIAFAIWWFAT